MIERSPVRSVSICLVSTALAVVVSGQTTPQDIVLRTSAAMAGWGWQDNKYAALASPIVFASTGPQRLRIQTREDGLSIDQVVLSPDRYLFVAPGALKNDTVILPR